MEADALDPVGGVLQDDATRRRERGAVLLVTGRGGTVAVVEVVVGFVAVPTAVDVAGPWASTAS